MGSTSSIEWTDATWNIAVGCTKVDQDCKFCYMYRESLDGTRFNPSDIRRTKTVFNMPTRLKEPLRIFTSSYTDFFHQAIDGYRMEAWDIIRKCPQHTFQILTKRPERILDHLPPYWDEINERCWIGTSIGSNNSERAKQLIHAKLMASIKTIFLSLEPLYAELTFLSDYYFNDKVFTVLKPSQKMQIISFFDWIIVGGESGNNKGKYKYRQCKLEWVEQIVTQCKGSGTAVFVKQLGTHISKKLGLKHRHGGDIDEWPLHLRVRQMPAIYKGQARLATVSV